MRLRDLGEFGLIDRIRRLAVEVQGRDVVLGIGDDAALLRPRRGEDLVVTSDAMVEGTHVRWDGETIQASHVGSDDLGPGISLTDRIARDPVIAIDHLGRPAVAWVQSGIEVFLLTAGPGLPAK